MITVTLIRCSHGVPFECPCEKCVTEGIEKEVAAYQESLKNESSLENRQEPDQDNSK